MVSRLNSRMFIHATTCVYASMLTYNISSLFMPSGRLEDFCFRLFFSMLLITFDFFYAVAEPVWMESASVASKVRDSLTTRFLREIHFARRAQGRFPAKPPAGPILHERKARKYLCYCNRFIRSIPVLRRQAKK